MKTRWRHPFRLVARDEGEKRPGVDDRRKSHQRAEAAEDERFTREERVAAVASALSFSRWRRLP
jgi:hypothetical protein